MNKISMFIILKTNNFQLWFLRKISIRQKWTLLNLEKRNFLQHYWSDKGFKGTLVNWAFSSWHVGSPKMSLTVPLNVKTRRPKMHFYNLMMQKSVYRKIWISRMHWKCYNIRKLICRIFLEFCNIDKWGAESAYMLIS